MKLSRNVRVIYCKQCGVDENKSRCISPSLCMVSAAFSCEFDAGFLNTVKNIQPQSKCGLGCNVPPPILKYLPVFTDLPAQQPHPLGTPITHREVPFGREPLGEVVEGIWLGADWVAVTMDLVEQVSRLVQAVITDVHILLFYTLWPPCKKEHTCFSKELL